MGAAEAIPLSEDCWQHHLVGHIDGVNEGDVFGWAYDETQPEKAISVSLRVAQTTIGEAYADIYRKDLERAGVGDGCHGFRIPVVIPFHSGQKLEIEMFDKLSGVVIAATSFAMHCRHPHALTSSELDSKSIRGLAPLQSGRLHRRTQALTRPLLKSIGKIQRHYKGPPVSVVPAGVQAKLARMASLSIISTADATPWPTLVLPAFDAFDDSRARVSIVIPVHNQFHLTYQCLISLILSEDNANLEIIVVDDASTDLTGDIERHTKNLEVIRNESNLGFLHSCNKAAALAKGDFIVFLNNDTEVEAGWIDSMLEVFDSFDDVGAVGAKLIYPDGTLQDAGGIVWQSGTPWNVGHGKDRDDPEYNYVREVDYLTGAALMVSRVAWQGVEGFSEQYVPAYYEDTDLAFKLRDAGYRTLFCPQATVVHYEGCSNGRDLASGVKQHQVINAAHFKAKWQHHFFGQGAEGQNLRRHKDRNRGLRVLMVDNAFPRLGHDAGSYAAIQETKLLLALGCKVTFLPHNLLHLGKHVDVLQRLGVECIHAPFQRSVAKFIENRVAEFDAVYITRFSVAEKIIPLVRQHGDARIIFNNADLHFLREMRTVIAAGQSDMSVVEKTRRRELSVMDTADAVLSYSDVELDIVRTHLLSDNKLFRCPWVLKAADNGKSWQQRSGISFLGGFAHPPNKQAMDWFMHHVMPKLLKRRPEMTLTIWGSHVPPDSGWEKHPGVRLNGYAASLDEVFSDTLAFIAPLQAGAGIKGKVLDSIAYAVPTILSPMAAEATGLVDGNSTLIAHTPEQWVCHIESLLDSEALWLRIRKHSIEVRDRRYSKQAGLAAMQLVFDYLELDTAIPRQQVVSS